MALGVSDLPLQLRPISDGAQFVITAQGVVMGQIKRINSTWKFKALWLDEVGDWVPGGGPLTDRHNATLDSTNAQHWQALLLEEKQPE
jgi:hypothetical protein